MYFIIRFLFSIRIKKAGNLHTTDNQLLLFSAFGLF
tara:strand:+ start:6268 stop:6375 length:108 start_codon:yes stop_codon:yes gene_type:complete